MNKTLNLLGKPNKPQIFLLVFRVYAPLAIYSGDKYKLTKLKRWEDTSHAPIEIWRNETSNWQADFIKFSHLEWDEMRKAIYTNFDRVYGRIVK